MAKAVLVDLRKCIGCRACQVACKRWNDREATNTVLDSDPKYEWTNPPSLSPQTYTFVRFVKQTENDQLKWTFAKVQCMHCVDPQCANGCPSTALLKTENGPVVYRKELCIGCKYCVNSCPFGVPQWDETNSVIEKCTFCTERLNQSLEPACVQACPTGTLTLMNLDEAQSKAQAAEAQGLHTYGLHEVGGTSWIYISDTPLTQLGFPERSSQTPSAQQTDLLVKFGGTGVVVLGAAALAAKFYAQRVENVKNASPSGAEKGGD
jgi:formate dehydrogenase iron-sulfur subunit